jgi:membrane-associated protease RseP (regulator of RpoE activity)
VSPDGPALPATAAKKVVMTYLGAAVSPVGDAMAEQLKLPAGTGLLVGDVEDGSPAAKAGIKRFDVLTWLNEQLLVNPPQLHTLVRLQKAGDKVTVKLIRGGKEQTVPVTLAEAERTVGGAVWAGAAGLTTGASGPAIYLDNPMNPVQRAGREQGEASSSRSYADNEHSFAWTSAGGKTNLVVKDTRGKVLFDGPITTDEDMKAVPEPIREKLRKMGNGAPHGGQGQGQGGNGKSLPPVPPPPPIVPHGPVDPPPAVVSPPMHQF